MKVLASVYACSPYDGSERSVGWNWVQELDKYHEVTALVCHVYQKDIEDYLNKHPGALNNTRFIYVDVPYTSWHIGYRLERLYYILWQRAAAKRAQRLAEQETFDLVHHITYVTCILPTYMHKIGLPFLYGPVSGGENTPAIIQYPVSSRDRMVEMIRSISQIFFRLTPNYTRAMKCAALILTTTEETQAIIPAKYQNKTKLFQAIGLTEDMLMPAPRRKPARTPRFLMAGRMLYWKGYLLGIQAFMRALERGCTAELTILSDTENNPRQQAYLEDMKAMCGEHLEKEIQFVSRVEHSRMREFYDGFDVLLNCSLRDSGCFVVMEAMSRGLPVICVDTGGPKVNTTAETAIKISPAPMEQMVEQIAEAICRLSEDGEKREKMGTAARRHAEEKFMIAGRTERMNDFYAQIKVEQ